MLHLSIFVIILMVVVILFTAAQNKKITIQYELKIKNLENIIAELSQNLILNAQKVKLSEDLKMNMHESNNVLSNKIVDLNMELFEEMFPKKNL